MGAVIGWSIAVAVLLLILFAPVGIRLRVSDRGGCSDVGQNQIPVRMSGCHGASVCRSCVFSSPYFPKRKSVRVCVIIGSNT